MKKALVLSGFLAAVALIVGVCLALSRERTPSPGAIVQACSAPQSGYVVVAGSTNVSADYLEQNWHTEHPDGLGMVDYNARGGRVATLTGGFSTWCPTTPLFWEHPLGHVH